MTLTYTVKDNSLCEVKCPIQILIKEQNEIRKMNGGYKPFITYRIYSPPAPQQFGLTVKQCDNSAPTKKSLMVTI